MNTSIRQCLYQTLFCAQKTVCVCASCYFSCVRLCDPMDCSCQAPLSMGFFRQEYWSVLPCHPPRDLPHPGIEPVSLTSPALAGGFFTTSATWGAPAHDTISLQNIEILLLSQDGEIFQ